MPKTKNIRIGKNPFLLFLPFLLFYIIVIFKFGTNTLWGDEIRHLIFARNLLHGYYSPPSPDINLSMGPGYPILLMPFIALHLPFLYMRLINAILLYLSIIFLFKGLQQIVSFKKALIVSLFWGCYFNSLEFIAAMYSEALTSFLISLIVFFIISAFKTGAEIKTKKYIYLSGFTIGYIVLTKIIFGYVIMCMILAIGLLWLINRKAHNYRKGAIILLIAFATTAPYLIYTYHLTGRMFYWGTSGGNNLYWMSTPYQNEFGNWCRYPNTPIARDGGQLNPENRLNFIPGASDSIRLHHEKELSEILKYKGVDQDDIFRKVAINNIKSHPIKFLQNCISNIGRIIFNYPYSYTIQKPKTLLRLPFNGLILILMILSIIPTLINWKKIIFPIRFIVLFVLLYLGGSIFGSAETRVFTIIVPMLLFWITYIFEKSIKINITKWQADSKK